MIHCLYCKNYFLLGIPQNIHISRNHEETAFFVIMTFVVEMVSTNISFMSHVFHYWEYLDNTIHEYLSYIMKEFYHNN